MERLDGQDDFSDSWIVRRLSTFQNFTYYISRFNYLNFTTQLQKMGLDKDDVKALSYSVRAEFLQEKYTQILGDNTIDDWKFEPYPPFTKTLSTKIIKAKYYSKSIYKAYSICDTFLTEHAKTLQFLGDNLYQEIRKEWLTLAKDGKLTPDIVSKSLQDNLKSKIIRDLESKLSLLDEEDKKFVEEESEILSKEILDNPSLVKNYLQKINELKVKLNYQPLKPLTDLEILSIIDDQIKEQIKGSWQNRVKGMESFQFLIHLPEDENPLMGIFKECIDSSLNESFGTKLLKKEDKKKRLEVVRARVNQILESNYNLASTFKEHLAELENKKFWKNKFIETFESYSVIKKQFIEEVRSAFELKMKNDSDKSRIKSSPPNYSNKLQEAVNHYKTEVNEKISKPWASFQQQKIKRQDEIKEIRDNLFNDKNSLIDFWFSKYLDQVLGNDAKNLSGKRLS